MKKVIVITGASSGLGEATALAFAKKNNLLILTARNRQKLLKLQKKLNSLVVDTKIIVANISQIKEINKLLTEIKKFTKRVDVLINLAGIWHGKNQVYASIDYDKFSQQVVIDTVMVGTMAPILLTHGLSKLMPKNSKIINISGTFENGAKGWLPYYVSKRSIEDLTIALAQEYEGKIQVNAISPSDTATSAYKKFFPQYLNEAIDPNLIGQQIAELSSSKNLVSGKVFVIKKGLKPKNLFHA